MELVIQKINKEYTSSMEFAKAYYTFITQINKIDITSKEMDLLCYCAINGTISTPPVRDAFIKEYNTPKGSVYNMVAKLQKLRLMVKINGKIRVNPALQIDFNKPSYKIELSLINKSIQ